MPNLDCCGGGEVKERQENKSGPLSNHVLFLQFLNKFY